MSSRSFLYDYERKKDKKARQWGNFDLDYRGDLVSSAPLTDHARQRMKERNIPLKDIKKHGVQTAHGVVVTAYRKNESVFGRNNAPFRHTVHGALSAPQQEQDRKGKDRRPDAEEAKISKEIRVPRKVVGLIIGAKGESIKKMRENHEVSIMVKGKSQFSNRSFSHVCIRGPQEQVLLVEKKYLSLIRKETARTKHSKKNGPSQYMEEIQIPRVMVNPLMTKRERRRIEEKYTKSVTSRWVKDGKGDNDIDVLTVPTKRLVINGHDKEEVLDALKEYHGIIEKASSCKQEIEVPRNKDDLILHGRGEKMRKKWSRGNVYVWLEHTQSSADDSNEFSKLHIRGSEEASVAKAYEEFKKLLKLK